MLFGTLEAGGTKMVLSVGNENNELLEQVPYVFTSTWGLGGVTSSEYLRFGAVRKWLAG